MPTILVRDLMQVGVPTCREDTSLVDVACLLVERNASALVVLDEDGNGTPLRAFMDCSPCATLL